MLEIAAGYERLASYAGSARSRANRAAPITSTNIYCSSNGDHWRLISDPESGRKLVRHEPNPASGGHVTETSVEEFLAVNGSGPEYEALRRILGDRDPTQEIDR
jgi:hypothetical protein